MNLELFHEIARHFTTESILFGALCFVGGFFAAVADQQRRIKKFQYNLKKKEEDLQKNKENIKEQIKRQDDESLISDINRNQ